MGLLDADITGPSIPRLFGVTSKPADIGLGLVPATSSAGIKVMSLNLLLAREDDPVVWRGPLIAGAVRQFWTDVIWGCLDYLIIDLPPGTGDAPLTVMQSLPVDQVVLVSSPQDLAAMVVRKAAKMAGMLGVSISGLIENMAGVACPHCGNVIEVFGTSHGRHQADALGVPFLGSVTLDPRLTVLSDTGRIEEYSLPALADIIPRLAGEDKR